jgi:hypothetical protein
MNAFIECIATLAKVAFSVAGSYGIYMLVQSGYVGRLDMKGRAAVMSAGTILATMGASAIGVLNGAGQFAFVLLVGLSWVIAFPWLIGKDEL